MSEVRFYHLQRSSLQQALPGLLMKALQNGHKILIKTPDESAAAQLNEYLWTYNPDSFLPHGTKKDGFAEDQPVYLTSEDENPNGADVLILTGGCEAPATGDFSLCCEIFDGNDQTALGTARARWKTYKEQDKNLTYWQQTESGWEKKDV